MNLRAKLGLTVLIAAMPLLWGFSWLRGALEDREFERVVESFVFNLMGPLEGSNVLAEKPEEWGGTFFQRGGRRFDRGSRRRGGRPRFPRIVPLNKMRRFVRPPVDRFSVWAYDKDFVSKNSDAPPFPPALRHALSSGGSVAFVRLPETERPRRREREERPPGPNRDGGVPPEREPRRETEPRRERELRREPVACAVRTEDANGPGAFIFVRGDRRRFPDPFWWIPLALCGCLVLTSLFAAAPMVRRIRRLTEDVRRSSAERYETPVTVQGRDEIARLGAAFNEAGAQVRSHVESLEERERTLRSFIGNTTHDISTPLTVLQTHLVTIRKRLEAGEFVEPETIVSALNEAHYMGSIVHNLSAVAKLEGGDVQFRSDPVDIGALVDRAVARHQPMARTREIELDYAVPAETVQVIGDVTLIEQAVSNVIHNAVRYNAAGGHVAVLLEIRDGEDRFSLRIIDDGPGIPENELLQLPERRFRGEEARTRDPSGLGLGLHIARDVAKRHGFELAFRRSEYGGLEVEFSGEIAQSGSVPDSPP